jgi:lipopolysaccharide/colanic/teichoic acid biosynthesis glycosyltransferase
VNSLLQLDQPHSQEGSCPSGGRIPLSKRVLDICLVLVSLPLLVPVAVVIGPFIRIVSPGPILFKQERVGFLGKRFLCFKFRTMRVGADTSVHQGHLKRLIHSNAPMVKMDAHGDPRVIPLGSLLRASGLDELPQVINVFRGEMSLVGPRPCLPYEFEAYLPWQRERFNTLPGLTGLWQVSGKNRTTFVEMIRLDIDYVRSRTLRLDLDIIFRTIPALFTQMNDARKRRKSFASTAQTPAVVPAQSSKHHPEAKPGLTAVIDTRRDA